MNIAQLCDIVRYKLNDPNALAYSDAMLCPKIIQAYRFLKDKTSLDFTLPVEVFDTAPGAIEIASSLAAGFACVDIGEYKLANYLFNYAGYNYLNNKEENQQACTELDLRLLTIIEDLRAENVGLQEIILRQQGLIDEKVIVGESTTGHVGKEPWYITKAKLEKSYRVRKREEEANAS